MFRIKNVRGSTVAKNSNLSPFVPQPKPVKPLLNIQANHRINNAYEQPINPNLNHPNNKIIRPSVKKHMQSKHQLANNHHDKITMAYNKNADISKIKSIGQSGIKNMVRPASKARNYHKAPQLMKQQKKIHNLSSKNDEQLRQKFLPKQPGNVFDQKVNNVIDANDNTNSALQKNPQFVEIENKKQLQTPEQHIEIQRELQKQNKKQQKIEDEGISTIMFDKYKESEQAQIKQRKKEFREQQQMQDKRRQQQARQQIQQIMKRRKQRQQRRLQEKQRQQKLNQLMAKHDANNISNENQRMGGLMYTNDPLAHFQFTDLIMDAQILKILKTSFNHFPSGSAIQAKKSELQRINQSYMMIKDGPTNKRLSDGLKNFRVELFNQIGQLIVQDQNNGYATPNFSVIQGDIRNGKINQEVTLMRGIPKQKIQSVTIKKICKVNQQCSICLEYIKVGEQYIQFPCQHLFHTSCTQDWVQSTANCPLCRKNLKF